MKEFEQLILQLATKYNNPDEFVSNLERAFSEQPEMKGELLFQAGITLHRCSYFVPALYCWSRALTHYIEIGNRSGEAECNGNIGNTYVSLGDFKKAIGYHKKALQIDIDRGDRSGESACYTNLGIVYFNSGYYKKAIDYHKKSLKIKKDISDTEGESKCCNNLGIAYFRLGDFKKAIGYHKKALQIDIDRGDRSGESACYTNLGNIYESLGNFRKAIELYEKELEIDKDEGDRSGESACYTNLGIVYFNLGDFKKAIGYHKKALQIDRHNKDRPGEAKCFENLGVAYFDLGDFEKAIIYHKKALRIKKEISNKTEESISYANLGNAYNDLGDFKKAIRYHKKALQIDIDRGDRSEEAKCYLGLGNAYVNLGEFNKAIEFYEKALQIQKKIGESEQERITNFNLAAVYCESDYYNNYEQAYDYCRRSIELSEIISEKLAEEQHIRGFQSQASVEFQLIVPLCLKLEKEKEAFEYTEKSKSKAFLDLMAATPIKPTHEPTNEMKQLLLEEEECLTYLRAIQTRHLRQTSTQLELGKVDQVREKLSQIYDKLEKLDPEYVFNRRAKTLNLDEIQQLLASLKRTTVLVEYFVTDKETLIFVISSKDKKLHVKTTKLSSEILNSYLSIFRSEVADYDPESIVGGGWLGLSEYLIKPISEFLVGHELVYFVPYGQLHYLPLHALLWEGEPLIKNYAVAYAPSTSLIKFCQKKGSGKMQSCVSFGIALKDQIRLEQIVEDTANGVAKFFNTKAYNLKNATKETALKEIENKDVVHFSCHGYLNQKDPLSSGVVLYNEEILSAKEIFDLKLNAEIVTLGACQTGVSERSLGDELVGLTRAFLYAGAPSLIVSLWSVNATSTKELILEFYKLAKSGVDKATALQQAQKKLMEKYPHPYYWAPFILVGKD